jgi:tetratricopeptide (TPR) repeat protein
MPQPDTTPASTTKRSPRTLAGTAPVTAESGRAALVAKYEAALQLMQQGNYEQAHAAFDKLLAMGPSELSDRARMYMSACKLQFAKPLATFASPEEQYDYAISLLNDGKYPDAREQFRQILAREPSADYAYYGLAVLASMTGDANDCLENLGSAIEYNPQNRIQARSDSDFQDMADDPRFTELLYPEV